ncbi:MAG: TPR domain-containing protein [Microgenomates group bacterium Gr01-1014_80]|nr:MAG: TPR domain-containing protein [Microgenomates group bacterium Gr01-1014_80]
MDETPSSTTQLAIEAALCFNWDKALKLNSRLIREKPDDVDALCRLAHAYFELCNYKLARKYYTLAQKQDPYNPIAQKNLKILQSFKKLNGENPGLTNGHSQVRFGHSQISPSLFLQEPGKTKVVALLKVAEPQKLSKAYCGMGVEMVIKNRGITITDPEGSYLGVLPDDTAHQLIRLTKGGNRYLAFIKSIRVNGLSLLVRETRRSSKFKNQPSFLEYSSSTRSSDVLILRNHEAPEEDPIYEEDQ